MQVLVNLKLTCSLVPAKAGKLIYRKADLCKFWKLWQQEGQSARKENHSESWLKVSGHDKVCSIH
jgi:hypothetical protein